MAEREQAHRHASDKKIIGLFARGQWIGFTLGLLAFFIGGGLILSDHDIGGLAAILGSLAVIISSLLFGSRKPDMKDKE